MEENKSILIVDDIPINIILLKKMLLITPYNIITATSGKEALDILNTEHIDLLLLDIMMPEINGYEVLSVIRKTSKLKDLPIIVSAFSCSYNKDDAISKGANELINNVILIETVNKYLK